VCHTRLGIAMRRCAATSCGGIGPKSVETYAQLTQFASTFAASLSKTRDYFVAGINFWCKLEPTCSFSYSLLYKTTATLPRDQQAKWLPRLASVANPYLYTVALQKESNAKVAVENNQLFTKSNLSKTNIIL